MVAAALQRSALGGVRRSPRFLVFMLVMLVAAVGYGGRDAARLSYMTELTGDASGIGVSAAFFAIGLAVGGLMSGPIADRFDPRRLLVAGMALQGLASLVIGAFLVLGVTTPEAYVVMALLEGSFAGACIPALVTTQAAMVPSDARGSAEIISILRLGIGAVIGIVLSGLSSSPVVTVWGVGLLLLAVSVPIAIITAPVDIPRRSRTLEGRVLAALRAHPVLRRVVVADLVLAVVIPTQFTNLILADRQEGSFVEPALIGGLMGVLVGRLVLSATGSRGPVRRQLLGSDGGFVFLAFVGAALVATGAAFASPLIPAALLFVGSSLAAYAQGLLAALVQQQVPDDVRGRLSGAMAAARSLLIAGSAALLTAIVVPLSAVGATAFVAFAGLVALMALRGFRGITANGG